MSLMKKDGPESPSGRTNPEPETKPMYRPLRNLFPVTNISPVFLSEDQRTFLNPISYLGGPRFPADKGNTASRSKESLISLD
ncbi:hypothetical protein J6590_081364 [Homalodisca vitripennis]|nr:hypothetical protein J6590_081364 [Homalodisca vitripennis]